MNALQAVLAHAETIKAILTDPTMRALVDDVTEAFVARHELRGPPKASEQTSIDADIDQLVADRFHKR